MNSSDISVVIPPRPYRIPVNLPISVLSENSLDGTVKNISADGLYFESDRILDVGKPITFELDLQHGMKLKDLKGLVVHNHLKQGQNLGMGLKFDSLGSHENEALQNFILTQLPSGMVFYDQQKLSSETSQIKPFNLLINGQDVDTGHYDYVPYADQLISDFVTTSDILSQVRDGKLPNNYQKYIYGRYCIGSSEQNQKAMEAARKAGAYWSKTSIQTRRRVMDAIHVLLKAHKKTLIELMVVEGHPVKLAEWQVNGMINTCSRETVDFFVSEMSRVIKNDEHKELSLIRRADGVVCVSPPGNAPCSNSYITSWALFSGNALVIKPPLKNPISTIFLWRNIIFEAAKVYGAPDGLINIVVGDSKQFLTEWLTSKDVNDVFYFGDSKLGLEIGRKAFAAGKKPILELSGNDMMMIWKDADLDGAVDALMDGFLGSTQICMVPKKALIHEDIFESVVEKFVTKARSMKLGLPSDPEVLLSPVMKIAEFYESFQDAQTKGARIECGGQRVNHLGMPDKNGIYIEPTVLRIDNMEAAVTMKCVQEENFFPMIPLIKISANKKEDGEVIRDKHIFSKMMEILSNNDFGLRASVWATSDQAIKNFVDQSHNSGLLWINAKHLAFYELIGTHGGTKMSGGPCGEMNYPWQKTSHLQGVLVHRPKKQIKNTLH